MADPQQPANNGEDGDTHAVDMEDADTATADDTERPRGGPAQRDEDASEADAAAQQRAQAASAFVSRDGDGNLQEVETTIPGQGESTMVPMSYGDAEEYMGDAGQMANIDASTVAEVLRNHVVDPDFEAYAQKEFGRRPGRDHALTGYVVEKEMKPFIPQIYLMSLFRVSGLDASVEMEDDGSATVELDTDAQGNLTPPNQQP